MKIKQPLVSIIVPVYNVESWLNKCIDSLLEQSYKNIEILLINDGSTDKSGDICNEYLNKSSKIRVFNNENKGLSYSRNFGMKNANGKYIVFIDSDDFISDSNIIEKFVEILEKDKSDFIYTSYSRFEDGKEYIVTENLPIDISNSDIKDKSGLDILSLLILKNSYHHAAYLKICKKDLLITNSLYFKEGVYHEDAEWTPRLFYYANKISLYNKPWYMRRMRDNSIITSIDEKSICKKLCDRLIIAHELIVFLKEKNASNVIIDDLIRMYWGDLMIVRNIKDNKNLELCNEIISSTRCVLENSNNKKYLIVNTIIKYFGVKSFINLLRIARI